MDDVLQSPTEMATDKVPVFTISCSEGVGLKFIYTFLNILSPIPISKEFDKRSQSNVEFQVRTQQLPYFPYRLILLIKTDPNFVTISP